MRYEEQVVIPGMEAMIAESEQKAYQDFTDKFKPKLTTDDCYTPEAVYEAVANWVASEYGIERARFVRPFWPGYDYKSYDYPAGCVVVDNPPFSLYTQIIDTYLYRGIEFFIFGPSLTLFGGGKDCCYIPSDTQIVYENGAIVRTGFATSLDKENRIRSAPTLYQAVKAAVEKVRKEKTRELPKYTYPDAVCTSAMVQRYSHYGVDFRVRKEEAAFTRCMDAQKEKGKAIFGAGFLLSERAAAERAAAERAAAERAAAERAQAHRWELSAREKTIIEQLGT